jgi:hypothetical protein
VPFHGGLAELGDTVPYAVDVDDAEDGSTDAAPSTANRSTRPPSTARTSRVPPCLSSS